ncbi:hypothetical protein ACQ4PT_030734 [Festuca glaucescens]
MEDEASQVPMGGSGAAPKLQLPTPGASRLIPPIVRVVEDEGWSGGPSEVILHQSARYLEGLFVDPGVYSAAHDVLGRVEQQQQSYAEAARRTATRLQRQEDFIAQQRRELDEACMDLSCAREQAQGAFSAAGSSSAEHLRKLLEDERSSRHREITLLEAEHATREDTLNGQIGSLEDRLRDQEEMIHEYMAMIWDLRVEADQLARETEVASQALSQREKDLQAQLCKVHKELADAKMTHQDADLRASEGKVKADRLMKELIEAKTDTGIAARRYGSEQRLNITGLQNMAAKVKATMPPLGIEMAPLDDTCVVGFIRFFADLLGRLELLQPTLE